MDRCTETVDVAVPVFNEAHVVAGNVARLHRLLHDHLSPSWRITIVDNGSTDRTLAEARRVAAELDRVSVVHLDRPGRGRALRAAWSTTDAAVVAYTDVDLSTGIEALEPMVGSILSGQADIAIASRLTPGARVVRGRRRDLLSRGYNGLLRRTFDIGFRDAQCGCKAMRTDVARRLLPSVVDQGWFFDTELLLLAEHSGLRIEEVPVTWIDDRDSRVRLARTVVDDVQGIVRVARARALGGGRVDAADLVARTSPSTR